MSGRPSAVVVGAGVFGVAAAGELRRRGHDATLIDPGPVPHPDASSTDVSKVVRMDYGSDGFYADLAGHALEGWDAWNRAWPDPPYHEDGILMLSSEGLDAGGFEAECFAMLAERGVPLERLDRQAIVERFPAWSAASYPDGYFNPRGGWVESGRVVARMKDEAVDAGVRLVEGRRVLRTLDSDARVGGVHLDDGTEIRADVVVVAAGAWTPFLLPHLAGFMWATGQPVVNFRLAEPRPFEPNRFPVWCADIANSGWYGFPINREGTLKVGHHGPGVRFGPGDAQEAEPAHGRLCADFLTRTFADAAGARIESMRLCLYCDTWDGSFLIDHDPQRPGLVVAAGGSGHGFKFAPVLGPIIADVVEGKPNRWSGRFVWRDRDGRRWEQARLKSGDPQP